jgi:predicted CXXCH cytochrome family protein
MKNSRCALIVVVLLALAAAMHASVVEHPGVLHRDDACSSCHADKTRGKSVHSVIAISCTVCHLAETQGDMTTLSLIMSKEQICFACHENSVALRRHSRTTNRICLDCHDAHNSNRPMLLKEPTDLRHRRSALSAVAHEIR